MKIFQTILLASIFVIVAVLITAASSSFAVQDKDHNVKTLLRHLRHPHRHAKNNKKILGTDFYPACDSITSLGYPCENHAIQTKDGFVLGAIRIPPKVNGSYPVFLQHGLIDCSATWTFNAHSNQNLATMLHDAGYDVWLGNSRGNHYSQTNLNHPGEDSQEYFRMTDMDMMGMYDVPANIDYVLSSTNKSSLSYVGHSQGTTQMFMHFSTSQRYADNLDLFVALAPVTRVVDTTSLLLKFLAGLDVATFLKIFGDKWFLTNDELLRLAGKVCPDIGPLCADLLMPLVGNFNPNNVNESQLDNYLRYGPGGTSVVNMQHWQQAVDNKDGGFAMHDYGATINEQMYGQATAPRYNLSQYTKPKTVLVAGDNDALADPQDVEVLMSYLTPGGSLVEPLQVISGYAHMDFVWGLDASAKVYNNVLNWIKKYKRG